MWQRPWMIEITANSCYSPIKQMPLPLFANREEIFCLYNGMKNHIMWALQQRKQLTFICRDNKEKFGYVDRNLRSLNYILDVMKSIGNACPHSRDSLRNKKRNRTRNNQSFPDLIIHTYDWKKHQTKRRDLLNVCAHGLQCCAAMM